MKRAALGYSALLIAVLCYAYVFYKIGIEPRANKPLATGELKYFCLLIVGPGLSVHFAVRNIPALSLAYLAVVVAWTVAAIFFMRNYVDYGHGYDAPFGVFILGIAMTWPPFGIVALIAIILPLERILVKLEARCDARRANSSSTRCSN